MHNLPPLLNNGLCVAILPIGEKILYGRFTGEIASHTDSAADLFVERFLPSRITGQHPSSSG